MTSLGVKRINKLGDEVSVNPLVGKRINLGHNVCKAVMINLRSMFRICLVSIVKFKLGKDLGMGKRFG